MPKPYLRDLRAAAVDLQLNVGNWVVAGVETTAPWPSVVQVVPYQGLDFILRPSTGDRAPTVCLNAQAHGLTGGQARDAILRFGSVMAWSGDWRFEVTMWVGGSHPVGIGRLVGNVVQDFFDVNELGSIPDEDTATALAFFREGITTHSPFYGFLNLYKVIAFIHRNTDGKVRGQWITDALPRLTEERAMRRLAELQEGGGDAAAYLWNEGRNAIAHSEKGTFVNPDRIGDQERIERDLPVMRALARLAIEEHFGIHHRLSPKAIRPSPISGFMALFGNEVKNRVVANTPLNGIPLHVPESVTLVVRLGSEAHAIEGMLVGSIDQLEGRLQMVLKNTESTLCIGLTIDMQGDELQMEPDDIQHNFNRSSRSGLDLALLVHNLAWAYMRNGSVELWDDATNSLLGKSAPYLPVNVLLRPEWHDECLAALATLQANAIED